MASLLRLVNCSNVQKSHQHFDRRSPQSKSASSLLPAMKPHVRVDLGDGIGTRLSRLNIDSNPADAYTHDTLCMLPTLSLWFRVQFKLYQGEVLPYNQLSPCADWFINFGGMIFFF